MPEIWPVESIEILRKRDAHGPNLRLLPPLQSKPATVQFFKRLLDYLLNQLAKWTGPTFTVWSTPI